MRRTRLRFESLAARRLLAFEVSDAINVTTLDDELDADPMADAADVSLREAIAIAAENPDVPIVITTPGRIDLDRDLGALRIDQSLSIISDPTNQTRIDGGGNSRVIDIRGPSDESSNDAIDVTLSGLEITGGAINGDLFDEVLGAGGGVHAVDRVNLRIANTTIRDNVSTSEGGGGAGVAVLGGGSLTIQSSAIIDNAVTGPISAGGGVLVQGDLAVFDSVIAGNTIASDAASGGGVFAFDGTVEIFDSRIENNVVRGTNVSGGGLAVNVGVVRVVDSIIRGNIADGEGTNGGGLRLNRAPAQLTGSVVANNRAAERGGGVLNNNSDLTMIGSTIVDNTLSPFEGQTELTRGGGLAIVGADATAEIFDTIIAGNNAETAPDFDRSGPNLPRIEFTFIGDNGGTGLAQSNGDAPTGNIIGGSGIDAIDPRLEISGQGQAYIAVPAAGSPLIDAGSRTLEGFGFGGTDLRGEGFVRIDGRSLDIGAFERQTNPFAVATAADLFLANGSLLELLNESGSPDVPGRVVRHTIGEQTRSYPLATDPPATVTLRLPSIDDESNSPIVDAALLQIAGVTAAGPGDLTINGSIDLSEEVLLGGETGKLADLRRLAIGGQSTFALSPATISAVFEPSAEASLDLRDQAAIVTDVIYAVTATTQRQTATDAGGTSINLTPLSIYQNAIDPTDVNGDGEIEPIDALLVINALRRGQSSGDNPSLPQLALVDGVVRLIDVTGDGELEPLDALRVINRLRRQSSGGEPVAEFVSFQIDQIDDDDRPEMQMLGSGGSGPR